MTWLNYHHLYYFWTVARVGTIAKAAQELRLGQPTISGQLKRLEESLGHPLFEKQGRRLALTDVGKLAFRYADEIFRLGNELKAAVAGVPLDQPLPLRVGVLDGLPKMVAERLLQTALEATPRVRLVCREGPLGTLLAGLALHELDVVLADAPAAEQVRVKAFNHALGNSGFSFFAKRPPPSLKLDFPDSLSGTPMLVLTEISAMRRALDQWFATRSIQPVIVAEFDDSALLNAFGERGLGVFAMPSVIEREVCRQYEVEVIGRTDEVQASFFAISVERRLRHPAIALLAERARGELFS